MSAGGGRAAPDVGVLGGEQGCFRGLRADHAAGRGALDRRGVPRRSWPRADLGLADRDRGPAAPRDPRTRRPADHGRSRYHQVPRQGGQRGGQARRAAGGGTRRRARLSPSPPGRAAVGGGPGHLQEAAGRRPGDGWPGGATVRGGARLDAGTGGGSTPPRPRPQPRSPAGAPRPPPAVGRRPARPGALTADRGRPWTPSSSGWSIASPAGCGRPGGCAARSRFGCASTTSVERPDRTRCPRRPPRPRRSSRPRGGCSPWRCR